MLIHATCIGLNGKGVLIRGLPGSGKSDLGLRFIQSGANLVSDDQTLLSVAGETLVASAPETIAGMLEIRHIGIIRLPFIKAIAVSLVVDLVDLNEEIERIPDPEPVFFLDRRVQQLRLPAFAASTPAKISFFLAYVKAS